MKRKTKWIDEGAYADGFNINAFFFFFCGEHILEQPGHEPLICPKCASEMFPVRMRTVNSSDKGLLR